MPIEITPQGEYVDSVTGNPVNMPPSETVMREGEIPMSIEIDGQTRMMTPSEIAGLDPRSVVRESEMSQMNNMMPQTDMTDIDKVRLLMDMGLNEVDAIEAVVREKSMGTVRPEEFGRMIDPESAVRGGEMSAMQQQAPMQQQMPMARPPMSSPGMGALPSAPPPRPDMSGMSREQMDLLRRGIDPFAEGMVR